MLSVFSVVVAVVAASAMAWLAWSLPGKDPRGVFCGVALPLTGMVAWTYAGTPAAVWGLQAVVGVVAAVWTYPWWSRWRIGGFGGLWLAVPVWLTGTGSALLLGELVVAGQRLVYGGFALLIAGLVWVAGRRDGAGFSTGVVAGFVSCLALLVLSGATSVVSGQHWTVGGAWGQEMADRFWGGPLLGYHPNFIGLTAVMVAMRIGPDPRFRLWQRLGSLGLAAFFLILVESRTSFIVAFTAAGVYGLGYLSRRDLPVWRFWRWFTSPARRRSLAVAAAPLLATGVVFAVAGGTELLFKNRYESVPVEEGGGMVNRLLSGRVEIWAGMLSDFGDDTVVEQLLGDAGNARGVYYTITDPSDPDFETQAKHTADNAAIGVLYRGGVLGLVAFGFGLWCVVRRVWRSGPDEKAPLWTIVVLAALLVGGLTEDEIASTSPAWLLLCCAELAAWKKIGTEHTAPYPPKSVISSPNGRPQAVAD